MFYFQFSTCLLTPTGYNSISNVMDKEEVEDMFNVQNDKLNPQEKLNCCCPEEEDNNLETPPCNCECPDRNHGGQIRKILGGLANRKLKISVRL